MRDILRRHRQAITDDETADEDIDETVEFKDSEFYKGLAIDKIKVSNNYCLEY